MPMDYDDNEFSIHNVELTEEGNSTVSPVLRPYDFEDGGHISFDSLVENEVFLGITGQEDNQWIEEYSHGTSSSVVESRRDNVWSEAASSESVEMLLKSVGQGTLVTESSDVPGCLATITDPNLKQDDESNHFQEAMVTGKEEEGALATEELDVSDEPCCLATNMDPNLKQDDESNHSQEAMVTDKEEEGATTTEEMDVSDEPCSLSINLVPSLKQEDENKHTQEAMVINKEEVGAFATEKMDASDEPGSLAISMDPNLKQDDGDISAHEAVVTNKKVGPLVTVELDPSDDPCSLNTNVDPNLKQDDGNNHAHETMIISKPQDHFSGSNVNLNCDKFYGTITKDSQEEAKVSCGELDIDVIGNKCELSEDIVDDICDDANHEARNIAIVSSENNLQEDLSTSEVECGNLDASKECNLKKCSSSNEPECSTKSIDNSIGSQTAVEVCLNSEEKPSNVESVDKPPFAVDIPIDEESKSAGSCNLLMTESCAEVSHDGKRAFSAFPAAHDLNNDLMHEHLPPVAVEDDDKPKSENIDSLKSNVCSPSKVLDVQSWHVEGSEKPECVFDPSEMCEGSNINDVGTEMNMCSSPEMITENTDLVVTPNVHSENSNKDQSPAAKLSGSVSQQVNDEIQSSEQDGGMCIDRNITLHEEGNARLPLDMDIAAHDSQQNVESVLSAEGCKAQGSEADITILAEPGCIDAKSPPILGRASSVNHDDEEIKEKGPVSDGTCEYESLKVTSSMVDCASLSVVETGASPHSVGEGVHGTSVENMNAIMSDLAEEANPDGLVSCSTLSTVDHIPCDSSAKVGDNVEAGGGMQESIPGNHVNMSIEQHACPDVVLTSEYNDSRTRHEEDCSDSPHLNSNNTELYQSARVEPSEGAIDDNISLPEATEDVLLTSECDDSHMRHEEDCSDSPHLNSNNTELYQSARVEPSEGAIDENISLPDATEDVVLTSECDDSHMRHEEDGSVSMDKLPSVSPFSDTNNTELSENTRVKSREGAIDENTSLTEATKDVALTSKCDDSRMSHAEDTSVSSDRLQSVSPLSDINNTKLSENTRVKSSESAIDENISLPEPREDKALTSECDDSHMRHGEDTSVYMDKLQSVSSLSDTNNTEPSENMRVKSSEGAIDENTSLPEATEDVVLTSECDDSHTRHEEDGSVPMDKLQSVSPLNTNNTELSQSTRVKSGDSIINENTQLPEAADAVRISECDDSHVRPEEDSCVSMDKLQSVSLLNINKNELSQSKRVKANEGAIDESASLPEATGDEQGKEQSISPKSDLKIDESFTFEVTGTAGLRETCKGLQLFPASRACNLSTTTEVHCIDSSSSTLDSRKLNEAPVVTPQTPGSGNFFAGGKERKTRRKSVGKESVSKGKGTTTTRSRRVEKSSPLSVTPPQLAADGHDIQFQELGPKEKVECTVTKSIPISNLPDLNSATCTFNQPFTDNQQVQLRAQILVYGSLISGMPPEEPHMIAAFGQSVAGRKTWEDAWHACLARVNGQKSHASTPAVQQPRSDLKDLGYISPDLGIKHSSTLSSTNKGSPPAVSPLIPVPSPLWNMSTPSCVGFQSRSAAFQQSFTPIHPPSYQTPPNPLWLSQSPFFGQWGVASTPGSSFPRFSGLPITEAVQLTPVNFSGGGPHTYSMPVVHSTLFSSQSTDGKKAPSESKSRKRKKVTAAVSSVPSQVLMTPPSAHPVPHTGGHNRTPFLLETRTDSVTTPVVTSIFSTSVTVSTPPASTSSSPGRFLSLHDSPRLGDKTVGNAEDMLKKVEQGYVQEADVNATKTWQTSSDSRSTKRTMLTASVAVNQAPVSTQAPPAVACLPQVIGHEISLLAQNRTVSVTAPAFCTSFPTSVAMSTPVSIASDSSPTGKFPETIYPNVSTHGYPRTGYQNMENALAEETLSKVEESKLQAANAALLAAAEVSNCQDVWSGLDSQNNTGVVSNAEAKLMSSIAAAATVGKMASAAAKIALNVAEQAKVMADEVFQSSKTENFGHISHPNVVNKATPASILKSVDKTTDNHPNSIISAAREAARRRIEAASAASKHAENLDAIVKAAELAAESISQVGKIIAMGDSSALRKLAEVGPEGFWKLSQLAYEQHQGGEISGLHLNSNSGKKNAPDLFIEEIQTLKHGQASPVHLAHNQMKTVIDGGSVTINEKDTRTYKAPKLSKAVGVSSATNSGSPHTYVVGHCITPAIWDKHNIREGCLVEVYKKDGKYRGAWLAANLLSLKDEKALVCYTEIQSSDEGSENVKEWVALEVEGIEEVPRIRIAHPMTTMRFEGARKRRRTAVTDYDWSKGDRVDVWMQDCWREGIVVEPNKIDVTTLTVQFPAQGETSVVRSWHVRPTLIWKDRKWTEWNGGRASQGEVPNEKRMRLGSPAAVNDKRKDKLPMIVESGRHEEQGTQLPLLSAQESCFNVGKSTDKPSSNLRPIQKERARVVFGVPKPGKKQKFMAVSTQYVDARSNKNSTANGSFRFSKAAGARGSKTDAMENQVTETKSRVKTRKPPVPWFRATTSRDSEPTDADSVENSSSRSNQTQVGPSSNTRRDPAKGPPPKKAFTFTSKPKSEQLNRGRLQVAPKIEVKEKSISQVNEPRRSNRKIQPTSRLLEGIQSSLTISKIPSVSHAAGQRRAASKGSTSHGPS